MPPKKQNAPSKKTEQKKKDKIVEDKTFGMKNKKGNKNQKYIAQVTNQVHQANTKDAKKAEQEKLEKQKKKTEQQKLQDEINSLFKPVEQKVNKGVDPKSVLCAFFKQGQCKKETSANFPMICKSKEKEQRGNCMKKKKMKRQ